MDHRSACVDFYQVRQGYYIYGAVDGLRDSTGPYEVKLAWTGRVPY